MVHHSWTYLSLINDIFGIKNHQIEIKEKVKVKKYDINFTNDHVIEENGSKIIPEVGEILDKKLEHWTKKYEEMSKKTGSKEVRDMTTNLT